jgi:hypothetical protein
VRKIVTKAIEALPKMSTAEREAFETMPYPGAKYPQAEYLKGKKGEVIYPGKTEPQFGRVPSAKAEAFMEERERIVKEIRKEQKKGTWRPYFDPAERYHVDPKDYPPRVFDSLQLLPKKLETIDAHLEKIGAPEVRARLQAAYKHGGSLGDTKDWYAMGQWEAEYRRVLGDEEGRKAFLNDFGAAMGATTSGLDPARNLLAAHYGNWLQAQGLPYPKKKWDVPFPVSPGRYGILPNLAKHERIMGVGGYEAFDVTNPKPHNFARSFIGDLDRMVLDEQIVGGMTPGFSQPDYYGLHERVAAEEAAKAGFPTGRGPGRGPGAFQDVAWFGFKNKPGQPMIHHVNEAIERTHRLTGMPRRDVVEGFIRKTIPMFGLIGAIGVGGETLDFGGEIPSGQSTPDTGGVVPQGIFQ